MATKKHNLTTGTDHITGKAGIDLFLGAKGELGSNDVLNGAGGMDTISAVLNGKHLAPVMKNIEKGIFTHQGIHAVGLDLAHAQQMTKLTFKNIQADVTLKHASHVSSVSLVGDHNHLVTLGGLDAGIVPTMRLSLVNSGNESVRFDPNLNTAFDLIDVSLTGSKGVTLEAEAGAGQLAIHSLSKAANSIDITSPGLVSSITNLTVTGSAPLRIETSQDAGLQHLVTFDGLQMDGAIIASFDSTSLLSVMTGSDNDRISIAHLGASKFEDANVDLGAGNDRLDMRSMTMAATMAIDGGDGTDTIRLTGNPGALSTFLTGFETLNLTDAAGDYTLGSNWTRLTFSEKAATFVKSTITGGTGLLSVVGDKGDQFIQLDDLGGTTDHVAKVSLAGGADYLLLDNLTLDATTQHFDGGAGHDEVSVTGHVDHLDTLFSSFEDLRIVKASGSYDLAGTDFINLGFADAPTTAVSFNNLAQNSLLNITTSTSTLLTLNAASSGSQLAIGLYGSGTTLGNATFGVFVDQTCDLRVESYFGPTTIYLSTLGSAGNAATLSLVGETALSVVAANGSNLHIDTLFINNHIGGNILGLVDGNSAFVASGATITGGSGSDVLVGGVGNDTIAAGAGNDEVHGSLGIDSINLSGGGLDMLIFSARDQSAYNSGDNVSGFNVFDGIDISALVSSVSFGGNVASVNAGIGTLSTNHSVGFFDTANHTLYVDINKDGSLEAAHDMEFHLTGLDSFNSASLIG